MVRNFCTESTWDMGGQACLLRITAARAGMVLISLVFLCVLTGIFPGQPHEQNDRACNSMIRLPVFGPVSFMLSDFPLLP